MIPDEIRNEIEAKCEIQKSKNNSKNKEMQDIRIKRERDQLLAKRTVSSNTCTIETSVQYLDVQIQGRQKATW